MLRLARVALRRDALNGGSSMTLGSKGMKLSPGPQRKRMPWTAAKEYVPGAVLNAKEKMVLDGAQLVDVENTDRASQVDPLEVLRATVATYEYNTSTGKNIFQLASQVEFNGRGQRFYRKEWQEGTYDKYVTLSAVDFSRDGNKGVAYGYVTFHGETTTRPVQIDFADVPGWQMEFHAGRAVPFSAVVPPPPSIGTDTPVDPSTYRLRAYPYYDAPNPAEFVERLLKDRGVLPDTPVAADEPSDDPARGDGSAHYEGKK
ncbi:hypothetical protein TraAM80_00376 [Trypanosoma rangeli]|uniref:Trafficking protein particle complex subunit n=1 Tax=Trypanosoma rangeli TaxID=5698 RepID=A0A422P3W3_TRYRA|nr:uncharacterized protein TraAM80_00376 [Trypanosoma rangeli]RNF12365.1 hypothetical protein TraAM80_00376 [Trypanosoma rangeli]|eukprot:RNF12365.1 hypothetical protein TraAM80_00376 [Trypanosoma rangeli]